MMTSDLLFTSFNFPDEIASVLAENNLVGATPVQAQAIPHLLKGEDVLATAQTGTGKTLAFALPIVAQLLANPQSSALVLVPTRELAQQVLKTFHMLTKKTRGVKTALLIGGAFMRAQCQDLAKNPRVIVGTPGRIIDHLMRRTLDPKTIRHVVLDEMDRMLDMGFGEQLSEIFGYLEGQPRQTAMFSATLPGHITKLAQRYLAANPVKVSVGQHSQPVARIKQDVVFIKQSEKQAKLLVILKERAEKAEKEDQGSCIIFVKTKVECDIMAAELQDHGFKAAAMHGDLNQSKRQRVLQDFRSQKVNILVATDIAARGIDVAHIRLVINFELPQAAEDYIHRIGRTARGGAEGCSISFVAPFENKKWVEILRLTSPEQAKAFQQQMGSSQGAGGKSGRFERRGSGFGGGSSQGFGGRRSFGGREEGGDRSRSSFAGRSSEGGRSFGRSEGRSFERSEGGRSFERPQGGRSFERSEGGRSFERSDRSSGGARSWGDRQESRSAGANRGGDFGWKRSSDRTGSGDRRFGGAGRSDRGQDRAPRTPARSFSVMDGQILG